MSGRGHDPTTLSPEAQKVQAKFFKQIAIANAHQNELSQSAIAARSDISPAFYSEMKSLKKPLSINSAVKIAAVFGLQVEHSLSIHETET